MPDEYHWVPPENRPFFTWNVENIRPGLPAHFFVGENFRPWRWTTSEAAQLGEAIQQWGQGIGGIENAIIGGITINPRAPIDNLVASVAYLENVPENVPSPAAPACGYLQIGTNANENIENAEIGFQVDRDWIAANNINENTIMLQHYVNGDWENLPTARIGEDENYIYMEATTPSFSVFAITGESATEATVLSSAEAAGVSIVAIAAVVVGVFIVVFVILWLRRSTREVSESMERLEASLGQFLRRK
jgi:PGF-pre-PGF domain-containing protein